MIYFNELLHTISPLLQHPQQQQQQQQQPQQQLHQQQHQSQQQLQSQQASFEFGSQSLPQSLSLSPSSSPSPSPSDAPDYHEGASSAEIARLFLEYAESAANQAVTVVAAASHTTATPALLDGVGAGGGDGGALYNNTLYFDLYESNETDLPTLEYPYANDSGSWATICKDVYNPHAADTRLEFWVCGVMLNVVGILGIIGNIISMIILSRPQMRSSINYLLIGLARFDTVLIITSMLLFGVPSVYPHTGFFFFYYNYIYPYISPSVFPLAMIAQTASIYMTFTVTLERYVAVCHPLRARALCTYGRAKIYFIVCAVFSLLYNFPRFWEVLTVTYQPPGSAVVLHCVRPSALRRNPAYINIYIHWCYLIVNYIIPFLTLAILNCLIYRQVKRSNRERQRLSRSEKREIGLATMLLCVVVVFFLFNFLALVVNISEAFYNFIDDSLTKVSNLLVTINSSANFLIYVIFGEKFKRIFLLIFFKRRLSRDQPDLIQYESSISNNAEGTINSRGSGRFSRHGTQRSTTATFVATNAFSNQQMNSVRLTQSSGIVKIKRNRAPSPGPCVYYPARDLRRTDVITSSNNNTALDCDWASMKDIQMTSGF